MSSPLAYSKNNNPAYELSRNVALRVAAEAVSNNDFVKANSIVRIVSRSIKEDGTRKVFTNMIQLQNADEIKLFRL